MNVRKDFSLTMNAADTVLLKVGRSGRSLNKGVQKCVLWCVRTTQTKVSIRDSEGTVEFYESPRVIATKTKANIDQHNPAVKMNDNSYQTRP